MSVGVNQQKPVDNRVYIKGLFCFAEEIIEQDSEFFKGRDLKRLLTFALMHFLKMLKK